MDVYLRFTFAILFSLFSSLSPASAEVEAVAIPVSADTSIFQLVPQNNFGGAPFFNAGTANNTSINRALLLFDLQGFIPPGSVILSGTLTLDIVRVPASGARSSLFGLHRVFQSWAEGVQVPASPESSPGLGAPAEPGEATWLWRSGPDISWTQPGGAEGSDFFPATSSTAFVGGLGDQMLFPSSENLVADLQYWLDHPEENYGWLLKTDSEDLAKTARSFASRESGFGPTLTVEFIPVPEPDTTALMATILVCLTIVFRWKPLAHARGDWKQPNI